MAPWDWLADRGEQIGNIGSNIDIPSALGPLAQIPQSVGERVGNIGSNTVGRLGERIGNWGSNTIGGFGEKVGSVGSNIDVPAMVQGQQPQQQQQNQTPAAQQDNANQLLNTTYTNLVNPLAASMFYSQTIAPMLKQLGQQWADQTGKYSQQAQANLSKFPMPAEFQSLFAQRYPQQAQDQLNLNTSLTAAAMQQPGYDAMIKRLGEIQTGTQNVLAQQAAAKALGQISSAGGDPLAYLRSQGIPV